MSDGVFWGGVAVVALLIAITSARLGSKTKIPTWVWAVVLCALAAGGAHYLGLIA